MSFVVPQIATHIRKVGMESISDQIRAAGMLDIFSTHSWAYSERREGLHDKLEPWLRGVDYLDHSIPAEHPVHTKSDRFLAAYLGNLIRQLDLPRFCGAA